MGTLCPFSSSGSPATQPTLALTSTLIIFSNRSCDSSLSLLILTQERHSQAGDDIWSRAGLDGWHSVTMRWDGAGGAPGCLTVFSPIFKTDNKTATNVKLAKITKLAGWLLAGWENNGCLAIRWQLQMLILWIIWYLCHLSTPFLSNWSTCCRNIAQLSSLLFSWHQAIPSPLITQAMINP